MTQKSQSGRPEPWGQATLAPATEPTLPRLDLQSAPCPLTHTYPPGVRFALRGRMARPLSGGLTHDASSF